MIKEAIDIHHFLPHRAPMLMVDIISTLTPVFVRTNFKIQPNNIFVENGVLSEFGLIENAAQTCSSIVAQSYFDSEDVENLHKKEVIGFISSIKSLQIHSLPNAGLEIETSATLTTQYDTGSYITCTMECKTFCGTELLLECEINLFIKEKTDEEE
ncbi:MAG TPA: ABC transporter permease [Flavobacterium sp.]|jgi:predicted hotdog family 3-hydroxylacyl-ACP dehydratase|nr:ABC transporter permease [Flavobacterium sp.]